jgi:farnesyl-diphosphate farnesyltransferase
MKPGNHSSVPDSLHSEAELSSLRFCRELLPEVSRTFALNIPVLPEPLDDVVAVAYLLCRIADALEDEAQGAVPERVALLNELAELVALVPQGGDRALRFAQRAGDALRPSAPPAEVKLVRATATVLQALTAFPTWVGPHVARCVQVMTGGMGDSIAALDGRPPAGLQNLEETLRYCYYVAGVVGEMLTGLFADYSPKVAARVDQLSPHASAFGRALQLANILKDIRVDLERGSCWLPRDRMEARDLTPANLLDLSHREQAVALLDELVAVACKEADAALEYSLSLPAEEEGLRLFCLWPLFFAARTLAELKGNRRVFDPAPVKISRDVVTDIMLRTQACATDDAALRALYAECLQGSPRLASTRDV